jgi:hypothetical protein
MRCWIQGTWVSCKPRKKGDYKYQGRENTENRKGHSEYQERDYHTKPGTRGNYEYQGRENTENWNGHSEYQARDHHRNLVGTFSVSGTLLSYKTWNKRRLWVSGTRTLYTTQKGYSEYQAREHHRKSGWYILSIRHVHVIDNPEGTFLESGTLITKLLTIRYSKYQAPERYRNPGRNIPSVRHLTTKQRWEQCNNNAQLQTCTSATNMPTEYTNMT